MILHIRLQFQLEWNVCGWKTSFKTVQIKSSVSFKFCLIASNGHYTKLAVQMHSRYFIFTRNIEIYCTNNTSYYNIIIELILILIFQLNDNLWLDVKWILIFLVVIFICYSSVTLCWRSPKIKLENICPFADSIW